MANVSYDTLTITIEADSNQANKNINTLSKNLQKLDNVAKDVDAERINEVKKLLQDIASIDFSNVSKGLADVVKAFNAFNNKMFMKATSGGKNLSGAYKKPDLMSIGSAENILGQLDFSGIAPVYNTLSSMTDQAKELNGVFVQTNGLLADLPQPVGTLSEELDKVGLNLQQIKAIQSSISKDQKLFSEEDIEKTRQALERLGYTAQETEKIIGNLKLQDGGNKGGGILGIFTKAFSLSSLLGNFLSLLRNRIFRKIIQEIYKAIQEGFQAVLSFDTKLQGSFNRIKDSFTYMKDAFGAVMSPLVQALEPLLVFTMDAVAKIANELARLFAILNGADGYAKAIKGQKDWANEIKKTQSLGIDELNVVKDDSNGNYELEKLKNTGYGLLSVLAKFTPILDPFINSILIALTELEPLFAMLGSSLTVLTGQFEIFTGFLNADFEQIAHGWSLVWKGMANYAINALNYLIAKIRTVLTYIENLFTWVGKWFNGNFDFSGAFTQYIPNIPTFSYANGGFPKEDGFFYANHGELVGQFSNGQTAVANNAQITEGIYQAVLQAMRESNSNGNVVINLDGYELARVITKRQDNFGGVSIGGANVNYGK